MKLRTLEQHWNAFGEEDPLWAILSAPEKRGGAWDLEEFLATGRDEIDALLSDLRARGIEVGHERALDFGCGIGRLTTSLADHFQLCDGVDLAPSMIEQAVRLNRRGERCRFHHNRSPHLHLFADESFDFALSLLVLQHMEPGLMQGYIGELVRVLRPHGIAYFNVPDRVLVGTELPPSAARASIECHWTPRIPAPGEVLTLDLVVHNRSELPWPASARLLVGNHWLAPDGTVLVPDDGRAAIEAPIPAGGRYEITLAVCAPELPGSYLLELDLLQEHRGWFVALGSPTLRLPLAVAASPAAVGAPDPRGFRSADDAILVPRMEMHVMSREETVAVIESAGGVVLDVIARDRCGPSVPSYDYVVGRSPTLARFRPRSPGDGNPAHAGIGNQPDLISFPLSSRRRVLGPASVLVRSLLRRAMLEVLHRQTVFNRASRARILELERRVEQLETTVDAQDGLLVAARGRIEELSSPRPLSNEARSLSNDGPSSRPG